MTSLAFASLRLRGEAQQLNKRPEKGQLVAALRIEAAPVGPVDA